MVVHDIQEPAQIARQSRREVTPWDAILSTATRDGTTYTIFDFVYGVGGFTQIAVCVCDCEHGALYLEGEAAKAEKIEYGARKASLSEDFVSASNKDNLVHSNAKELCRKTDE